jgi:hypothetical protein
LLNYEILRIVFDVDIGGDEGGDELSKMWRADAEETSPEDVVGHDE